MILACACFAGALIGIVILAVYWLRLDDDYDPLELSIRPSRSSSGRPPSLQSPAAEIPAARRAPFEHRATDSDAPPPAERMLEIIGDHCYAETLMDTRMGRVRWGAGQPRKRTSAAYWRQPLRWTAQGLVCADCGGPCMDGADDCECGQVGAIGRLRRRRIFCASLADVFDNKVEPAWRTDLWALIQATPNLDWLILTKRIGNVLPMLPADWGRGYPNVWLGITITNQAEADRDIPKLIAINTRLRYLSCEPLLGPIDLRKTGDFALPVFTNCQNAAPSSQTAKFVRAVYRDRWRKEFVDWVIAGGESGRGARPAHPDWFRMLRDQCNASGTPFHFKQWGAWAPGDQGLSSPDDCRWLSVNGSNIGCGRSAWEQMQGQGFTMMQRVGKRRAGCLLDGREHKAFPAAA